VNDAFSIVFLFFVFLRLSFEGGAMGSSDSLFRLIALLQCIPRAPSSRSTTTLMQFMEEQGFIVSARMLQRDLEKLSQWFPIDCDTSEKPYRWQFHAGFKSALPAMDAVTALSWVLAEDHLQPLLPAIAFEKLQPQFQQARVFLNSQSHNRFNNWRNRVQTLPNCKALVPAKIDSQTWYYVTEALLLGRVIEADYLSRERKEVQRLRLHPAGLVVRHNATYLVAMINDYEDMRHLALHRLNQVNLLDEDSREKVDFDLAQYINAGAFGYPIDHTHVTLKALFDSDVAWHLGETPLNESQILTEQQGKILLTAQVPNDHQTLWWLMGFGSKVEVITPKAWRDQIIDHAKCILKRQTD
jgi:predicted DNA-binding transcriptional regulator YafY